VQNGDGASLESLLDDEPHPPIQAA
jgi:hypothetical protein